MRIDYSKRFIKQLKKAPLKIRRAFKKRFALFILNPFAVLLNNHSLKEKWQGFKSIDITGDWRAIFTADLA
ncbi:MAG: hypothetical protein U0946_03555 [Patescibacteria group bacterium]|nr:hypothetical protein [Patescibacteria group bacterium]